MSRNRERFPDSLTDKMYSRWHRTLPNRVAMINLDGLEYCERCRAPLAMIETTVGDGPRIKPVTVMRRFADAAHLPAYTIIFRPDPGAFERGDYANVIVEAWVKRVTPNETGFVYWTGAECAAWLTRLHDEHTCSPEH